MSLDGFRDIYNDFYGPADDSLTSKERREQNVRNKINQLSNEGKAQLSITLVGQIDEFLKGRTSQTPRIPFSHNASFPQFVPLSRYNITRFLSDRYLPVNSRSNTPSSLATVSNSSGTGAVKTAPARSLQVSILFGNSKYAACSN